MKNNLTEEPQTSIKPRNYLIPIIILFVLMGMAIGVFTKSVQQLSNMQNPLSYTATPSLLPTNTDNTLNYQLTLQPTPTYEPKIIPFQGTVIMSTGVYMLPPRWNWTFVCYKVPPNGSWCISIPYQAGYTPEATSTPSPTSTRTFTPTPTATFTPTPTATTTPTPTPTWTLTPKPFASPVMVAGGSMFVFIVCFVILLVIVIRFVSRWSQRTFTK